MGAVPSTTAHSTRAFLHLFGKDLSCPSSGRFAQITDGFEQPDTGTKAVRFEVGCKVFDINLLHWLLRSLLRSISVLLGAGMSA